jgi:hypothetical protein
MWKVSYNGVRALDVKEPEKRADPTSRCYDAFQKRQLLLSTREAEAEEWSCHRVTDDRLRKWRHTPANAGAYGQPATVVTKVEAGDRAIPKCSV